LFQCFGVPDNASDMVVDFDPVDWRCPVL